METPRRKNGDISRLISNINALSPLRKSVTSSTPFHSTNHSNDDNSERNRRRSCLDIQRRVSSIGVLNRTATDSEDLPESSLQDHYQKCVKLFAENKINAKNVWSLNIIEYMKIMLKKNMVMKDTLKLASTSLDISSKVYGLRVDDIHSEVMKLANNMARIELAQDRTEDDDNNEQAAGSANEDEAAAAQKKKEKKKKKRMSFDNENAEVTIAQNESSLNGAITYHNTACTGAAGSGSDRLYTLSMSTKAKSGWELLVNCRTNYRFWDSLQDNSEKPKPASAPVALNIPAAEGKLCNGFEDFVIDQWTPADDDVPFSTQQANFRANEVIYDENGLPVPELDTSVHNFENDNFDNDDAHDNMDDLVEEVGARQAGIRPAVAYITDMRPGNGPVSDVPLQYSYRAAPVVSDRYAITGVWAGPSHWKIKCLQRNSTVAASNNASSVQGVAQRAKRIPRAGPQAVDLFDLKDDIIENLLNHSEKRITRYRTQNKSAEKWMLPEDMSIDIDDIGSLNLRPQFKLSIEVNEDELNATHVDLNMTGNYQYDNCNDADYCSQTLTNDGDPGAQGDDNHEDHDDGTNVMHQTFTDDNMVDMPNMVPRTFVPYATQAKRMDIKKLKDAIWRNLAAVGSGDDSHMEDEAELQNANFEDVSFGTIYQTLPAHVSSRMAEELSYPLAFVALLHLANERTLKLEGQQDLLDIHVTHK